jgi:predicted dehydrogenase
MPEKYKIGIVGCGGIAFGKHLPNIKEISNVEITAFCDIVIERAEDAAKQYGIPGSKTYLDYKDLLKDDSLTAVYVLTPNCSHAEITVAALDAGKHVMCEKPMAMNGAEADAMCEAAKRNNKILTIGYQTRSSSSFQYARDLVESGAVGDIYFAKCPAIRRRGVPGWGVFTDKEKQGGGPLIDIGTHSIDACLYVMNNYDVESVMGAVYQKLAKTSYLSNDMGIYDPEKITTEDFATAFVRFKNGATMIITASWCLNDVTQNHTVICGTKAGLELDTPEGRSVVKMNGDLNGSLYTQTIRTNNRMRNYVKEENYNPEQYEQRQFWSAITNGTEILTKPEQAAVVTKIIEAVYKSSETGKAVYFD